MSFRRNGYRMIGATEEARYASMRRRYVGAGSDFGPLTYTAPHVVTGEGQVQPAAPAPVRRNIPLVLKPPAPATAPAPAPARTNIPLVLSPQITSAPPAKEDTLPAPLFTEDAAPYEPVSVITATPECPSCTGKVVAGFAAGALLMYLVGLLTREMNKKKKRR
jgi:hypothetical protein